jgi:hypothetical protein
MAQWRVKAALSVPRGLVLAGPDGKLLEQAQTPSRIGAETRTYGNITVALRKRDGVVFGTTPRPNTEIVELVADVPTGDDPQSALATVSPILEKIAELISFELGAPALIGSIGVIDATPPVEVGEDRQWLQAINLPTDRSLPDDRAGGTPGVVTGDVAHLPLSVDMKDSEEEAALRWFVKSLRASALVDQFISAWIALEILYDDSDVRVSSPYHCRNGHPIEACPTCNAPTEQPVRGESIREFLVRGGMSEHDAKTAWKLRQIMHGNVPFDSKLLDDIGDRILQVRAVVGSNLKQRFGLTETHLPRYEPEGLVILGLALGGTTKATQELIDPIA